MNTPGPSEYIVEVLENDQWQSVVAVPVSRRKAGERVTWIREHGAARVRVVHVPSGEVVVDLPAAAGVK